MNPLARIGGFAVAMLAAFAIAFGVGHAVGPDAPQDPTPVHQQPVDQHGGHR